MDGPDHDYELEDAHAYLAELGMRIEQQLHAALFRHDQALALEHLRAVLADVLHEGQGVSDGGTS